MGWNGSRTRRLLDSVEEKVVCDLSVLLNARQDDQMSVEAYKYKNSHGVMVTH